MQIGRKEAKIICQEKEISEFIININELKKPFQKINIQLKQTKENPINAVFQEPT